MQNSNVNWPINWDDYEHGRSPRQGSVGSVGSRVQFDETASASHSNRLQVPRSEEPAQSPRSENTLRHRRSSLSVKLASVTQAGGPNSLENFARSWSRAANFIEIPQGPSFVALEGPDEPVGFRRSPESIPPAESRGLLRQQLERQATQSSVAVDEEQSLLQNDSNDSPEAGDAAYGTPDRQSGIFERATYLGSPFSSSYGGAYGSLPSRFRESSAGQAGKIYYEPQALQEDDAPPERLLVKVVEQEDGSKVQVIVGQSTLPQTVFNSINVLIGVGLLSLPLGLKQSGWIIGMAFLLFAAVTTRYTGGVLAKCLDIDHSLVTFSDLAWKAFGSKARIAVGLLFTMELLAACVALVILFADSLNALFPSLGIIEWKVLCGIIMIPLSFVPLRYLSFTSVLGILSCLGIVTLIFVDGLIKPNYPGSLRDPAAASVFPRRWSDLPLSFGLLMSPWGGHSVFPNIYRDMRHPQKYTRAINYTYLFTYLLDVAVAVAGYIMFGQRVHDEVTSNIIITKGYPAAIAIIITVFISIIPITKIPLNARPIIVLTEAVSGLAGPAPLPSLSVTDKKAGSKQYTRVILKALMRTSIIVVITILAIVVPGFDTVMALLGSAMGFSICIILPVAFNLKIFHHELSVWERCLDWMLIVLCSILAVIGTVWVFLPKKLRQSLDGF